MSYDNQNNKEENKYRKVAHLLGLLGMCIFFYFAFDLVLNDYSLKRTIIEIALALTGLFMPLLRFLIPKRPGSKS